LPPERTRWSHPWIYGLPALIGLVVLGLTAIPIDATSVPDPEQTIFRWVNDRTFVPFLLVWPFMQLGNFLVIPTAGLIAALTRRYRLCAAILGGGVLVWLLAKGVKRVIERGRPFTLLPDVHVHGTISLGLGYPSGHAAVAAVIATVCWPYLHRRGRLAAASLVLAVCLARMWVGAHLPLDVLAGATLGVVVGSLLVLIVGRPVPASQSEQVGKHGEAGPVETWS
jgi:undecaprenyl-diphosphatase